MMRAKLACALLALLVAPHAIAAEKLSRKPWLGMALVLRDQPRGGKFLYVAHVPESTPAHQAGIQPADLIAAIDGKPIKFQDDLDFMEFIAALKVGKPLTLRIIRAGKAFDVRLVVGALPVEYEERWVESLQHAREARQRSSARH
jgi:S1-C subfamily serine protease